MSYRKFQADHLFTGNQWLNDQQVLITSAEGDIVEILPVAEAGDDIQRLPGILSPGLVNCHCHLELSHLKGMIPEGTGIVDFLLSVTGKRAFEPQKIAEAIHLAEVEMLRNGIVATGDICNTTDTLAIKQQQLLYYHNFIETIGFVEKKAETRFEASHKVFEAFSYGHSRPVFSNSIVPHAPYSVSPALFELITHFPGNRLLTMHNQESLAENEFFDTGAGDFARLYQSLGVDISFFEAPGGSSLRHCMKHFLPNQTVILVHNAVTSQAEIDLITGRQLSKANFIFCVCPNANLYIGNPLPNLDLLRRSSIPIVVGTDSLASNHHLDIIAELKTIRQHFPHIEIFELLQWATINGSRALDIANYFGSFSKATRPGVILIGNNLDSVKRLL